MTRDDYDALLALNLKWLKRREPETVRQVEQMVIDGEPLEKILDFAAFNAQMLSLHLSPFEMPPCWVKDPPHPDDLQYCEEAYELLKKMQANGVSRWHPDPLAAIAEAERKVH
jgi:hypothetical protein